MGRDVAHREGPDPVDDQHYVTKGWLESLGGLTGLPVNEDANTLVHLGFIGPAKFALWGGIVGEDPVTIVPDDANDVSQALTFVSVAFVPSGNPEKLVEMRAYSQLARPQFESLMWGFEGDAQLVPGGHAATVISEQTTAYPYEIQINVEEDGSVTLTRTNGTSLCYIGLLLMWI